MKFITPPRKLVAAVVVMLSLPSVAQAQNPADPQFAFSKAEEAKAAQAAAVKAALWTAQVKGGLLYSTGNAEVRNGSFGGAVSRKAGDNKLALDVGAAYGNSTVRVARDKNMDAILQDASELGDDAVAATNNWNTRGRYDRFVTANNAAYVLAQIGADRIAGKRLLGSSQAGYSRQLLKSDAHTWVAELGYDFSYESYLAAPAGSPQSVAIHSARLYVGEIWKISGETGVYANTEVLFNLSREKALKASDTTGATATVAPFGDTRAVGKAGLTTTLWKNVSFGFGVTLRYDQNPAPRPAPKGFTYAPGFQPFAQTLDTATEATLIITFL